MNDYIVAIISMLGTCIGSMFGVIASARLTNFRLESLEKKVDKHNNFAEVIPVIQSQISNIYREINEIKEVKQ